MAMKLNGLVAATLTPFHSDGSLNLAVVEKQAESLIKTGVSNVFVAGTTGEALSLTVDERIALAQRWSEVIRGSSLRMIVHVGCNSLHDSARLATHAEKASAIAISSFAPNYFKPQSLDILIDCCAFIAKSAPMTPFYYYDIPILSGVTFSSALFLEKSGDRIPTLAGLKFTNNDLMTYQKCLRVQDGRFDVPYGFDECLLPALALGASGAVGSTYNFAGRLYNRLIDAFRRGDLPSAREEQFRSVQFIDVLANHGFLGSVKALMKMLGQDFGPVRLPLANPSTEQLLSLRSKLEAIGFFDWI